MDYNCPDCLMVKKDCGNCKRAIRKFEYPPVPVYPVYPAYPGYPSPWYPTITYTSDGVK